MIAAMPMPRSTGSSYFFQFCICGILVTQMVYYQIMLIKQLSSKARTHTPQRATEYIDFAKQWPHLPHTA